MKAYKYDLMSLFTEYFLKFTQII